MNEKERRYIQRSVSRSSVTDEIEKERVPKGEFQTKSNFTKIKIEEKYSICVNVLE